MAVIFTEGFDTYGTSNGSSLSGFDRKWPSASFGAASFEVATGRFNGKAVHFNSSFSRWMQTPVFAIGSITVGFAFRCSAFPSMGDGNQVFLALYDSSANQGISVALTPTGEVAVYLGGSLLATTSGLALTVNTWHSVELSVVIGNSGSYDLHVDGASVLSASTDTQPGSSALVDVVRIGKNANSSMLPMFDDFWVADGANEFLHDFRIQTVLPTSDVAVECTPSSGDNYECVDDNPADADSSYVEGGSGDSDVYGFPAIDGGVVHGVCVNAVCRQSDATPFYLSLLLNGDASAPQAIGSSDYVTRFAIFDVEDLDIEAGFEIS